MERIEEKGILADRKAKANVDGMGKQATGSYGSARRKDGVSQ